MRGDEHVARGGLQKFETLFEVLERSGISASLTEPESAGRDGRKTVRIHQVAANGPQAGFPGPSCPPWSVAGRQMQGHLNVADPETAAIGQGVYVANGCDSPRFTMLRIVWRDSAFLHDPRAPLAGDHPRATAPFEFPDASSVVKVDMGVQDDLHILNSKTQGLDVGRDLSG